MKKPKFKLLKEFKAFISKGNALDLAVGMVIGSAFTAIVTALVNGILKPLINAIPLGNTGTLQTVLKPAVVDDAGNIITQAIVLDWGAVISAIITFLLTAIVLFAIIKAINTAKNGGRQAAKLAKKLAKGLITEEEAQAQQAQQEISQEVATQPQESTEDLLREIRDLLRAKATENVTVDEESVNSQEVANEAVGTQEDVADNN